MKAKILSAVFLGSAIALAAPLSAQGEEDWTEKVINAPLPASFTVHGLKTPPKPRADAEVLGGKALRVKIPGKGANPWDISLSGPISKPVRAGDNLVLAFWARLVEAEGGATTLTLPNNSVQLTKEPYTAFLSGPATIGPKWEYHEIRGKADRSYAAGDVNFSMHLATGKQVVDFGPVFVFNLSQ
jgi:hypothetical protein